MLLVVLPKADVRVSVWVEESACAFSLVSLRIALTKKHISNWVRTHSLETVVFLKEPNSTVSIAEDSESISFEQALCELASLQTLVTPSVSDSEAFSVQLALRILLSELALAHSLKACAHFLQRFKTELVHGSTLFDDIL